MTTPPPDIAAVAGKLTKVQRARMVKDVIVLRSRHDTRVALNLERLGLVERGRHLNQFVPTDFGLALRQHLLENGGG